MIITEGVNGAEDILDMLNYDCRDLYNFAKVS